MITPHIAPGCIDREESPSEQAVFPSARTVADVSEANEIVEAAPIDTDEVTADESASTSLTVKNNEPGVTVGCMNCASKANFAADSISLELPERMASTVGISEGSDIRIHGVSATVDTRQQPVQATYILVGTKPSTASQQEDSDSDNEEKDDLSSSFVAIDTPEWDELLATYAQEELDKQSGLKSKKKTNSVGKPQRRSNRQSKDQPKELLPQKSS